MIKASTFDTQVTDAVVLSALPKDSMIYEYVKYSTTVGIAPAATYLASLLPFLSVLLPPNKRIQGFGSYDVPTNIYTLVVGRSGFDRKSTGIDTIRILADLPLYENTEIVARDQKNTIRAYQAGDIIEEESAAIEDLFNGEESEDSDLLQSSYLVKPRTLKFLVRKEKFASGEALLEDLVGSPEKGRICISWDEISTLLSRAKGGGHQDALKQDLTNYYDGNPGGTNAKSYKHKIDYTDVNLVAGITPVYAQEMLDWKDLSGGFFSRFFITMSFRQKYNQPIFDENGIRLNRDQQRKIVEDVLSKTNAHGGRELKSVDEILAQVERRENDLKLRTVAPLDEKKQEEIARWFWIVRDYTPDYVNIVADPDDELLWELESQMSMITETKAVDQGPERQGAFIRGYTNIPKKMAAYFAVEDYLKSRMPEIEADIERRKKIIEARLAQPLTESWVGPSPRRLRSKEPIYIQHKHLAAGYRIADKIHWPSVEDFYKEFGNTEDMRLRGNVLSVIKEFTERQGYCGVGDITQTIKKLEQGMVRSVLATLEMEGCILGETKTRTVGTQANKAFKTYVWVSDGLYSAEGAEAIYQREQETKLSRELEDELNLGGILIDMEPTPAPTARSTPSLRVVNAQYDPYDYDDE